MLIIDMKRRTFNLDADNFPIGPIFEDLKRLIPNIGFFAQLQFDDTGGLIASRLNKNASEQDVQGSLSVDEVRGFAGFGTLMAERLQAAKGEVIAAAREVQYARQAVSFWFTDDTTGVDKAHVRVNRADLDSMNDFGPLLEGDARSWDANTFWYPSEPGYDVVPLPNETAAKRFKLAFISHHRQFKEAFLRLMQKIQAAPDLEALAAIDVTADEHWPNIEEPS